MILPFAFAFSATPAWACPDLTAVGTAAVTAVRPDACAKAVASGASCSWATSVTARRVLQEGADFTWVGPLVGPVLRSSDSDDRIAVAFGLGAAIQVVRSEFAETILRDVPAGASVSIRGRVLDIDGTRYAVLTSYETLET